MRRASRFYLDLNGNRAWNSGVDGLFSFGSSTDTPIIGDWNGDGTDDLSVWRAGIFYRDANGNRSWNSGSDTVTSFGASTDVPLIGYLRPKDLPGPLPAISAPWDSSRMTVETLKKKKHGKRWSVESFMSALKQTTGSMLSARSERALFTEVTLRVATYALRR